MNKTLVDKLTEMKQVGGAWQKGNRVDGVLEELHELMTLREYETVVIARDHYLTGAGRQELDRVCNELIQKYRHDPPDPRKRTLL